jgi:hypothetical protein
MKTLPICLCIYVYSIGDRERNTFAFATPS